MASRFVLSSVLRSSPVAGRQLAVAPRFFSASATRGIKESNSRKFPGLKESDSQNPDINYEGHKQDSLKKQDQGKGHWKPELASDSEEAVKADRSGAKESSKEAIERLQERTKQAAEETSKHGTSMKDGL